MLKEYYNSCYNDISMLVGKSAGKKRVKSVFTSSVEQTEKKKQKGNIKCSERSPGKQKVKRQKRFCSVRVQNNSRKTGQVSKETEIIDHSSIKEAKEQRDSLEVVQEKSNPHFMTVADLTSGDFVQRGSSESRLQTPINQYQEESTINANPGLDNVTEASPIVKERQLDQTIGRLKSKQETIDILNKTIQTRLVEASPLRLTASNKIDIYEVQMNYYVQRISQLQKQLHEKNKLVAGMAEKNAEFSTLVKNNRKLIGENHRLREERELLERENQALKNIFLKKIPRKE